MNITCLLKYNISLIGTPLYLCRAVNTEGTHSEMSIEQKGEQKHPVTEALSIPPRTAKKLRGE